MLAGFELTFLDYSLIFLLVALAGVVDSIAGGGGLITVPTYLAFGMPPALVLGTNKAVSTIGTSVAVGRFVRSRSIDWRLARFAVMLAFFAAIAGAWLSRYQSRETMTLLLLFIVPVVLFLSLRPKRAAASLRLRASAPAVAGVMGLVMGGYDGFFGPGTGSFLLFGLTHFLHLAAREASSTARVINFASNLGALGYFASTLQIHWPVAVLAAIASMTGNWVGSHLVIHRAEKVVRPVFFTVLTALLGKLLYDLLL